MIKENQTNKIKKLKLKNIINKQQQNSPEHSKTSKFSQPFNR